MTRDEVQRRTECIARLASQLSKQPRLQAEVQRARRQFFGDDPRGAGNDAAEHRFAEWFLPVEGPQLVIWDVEAEARPGFREAFERLELLRRDGPTRRAYGWPSAVD